MREQYDKIQRFIDACDELLNGKYMDADRRIADILKAIAASRALTDLFSAVTDKFDYPAAKRAYLKFPAGRGAAHGAAYLPSDRGELIAFVFCLLVEFDGGKLSFNEFLLRYFYEDGSYTASFALFVQRMIRPFRDIVSECFPELHRTLSQRGYYKVEELLGELAERFTVERANVAARVSGEDGAAGELMLGELTAAAGRGDVTELKALLCGYRYFLRALGLESEESRHIFELAAKL